MCLWAQVCRDEGELKAKSRRNHCLPAEVLGFSTSTPPGSHSDREVTQGTKEMGLTAQAPCGKRRGQTFAFTLQAWWTLVSVGQLWR